MVVADVTPEQHADTNQPVEQATGVQIIRRLERAVAVIRAEHAAKAAIAGSPCVCEWCRDAGDRAHGEWFRISRAIREHVEGEDRS